MTNPPSGPSPYGARGQAVPPQQPQSGYSAPQPGYSAPQPPQSGYSAPQPPQAGYPAPQQHGQPGGYPPRGGGSPFPARPQGKPGTAHKGMSIAALLAGIIIAVSPVFPWLRASNPFGSETLNGFHSQEPNPLFVVISFNGTWILILGIVIAVAGAALTMGVLPAFGGWIVMGLSIVTLGVAGADAQDIQDLNDLISPGSGESLDFGFGLGLACLAAIAGIVFGILAYTKRVKPVGYAPGGYGGPGAPGGYAQAQPYPQPYPQP